MERGNPSLLGSTVNRDGVNFAVYSSVASRVELCLFDENGRQNACLDLPHCDNGVWHGFVPGMAAGRRYGYRVHGAYRPEDGLFCDPGKLLIDPYARRLDGNFFWHSTVYAWAHGNSADYVPKSVVCETLPPLVRKVRVRWADTIFYEANVRGFTMRHPAVSREERGTFDGMRNGEVVSYLKALGVTSIELMPVQAFIDEHHLSILGLRNYWGYNAINFFAPMSRYAQQDPVAEFRAMVDALHDAGLEVILDVAYNHTGEGGNQGATVSFRGLDNLAYYRTNREKAGEYVNDTGCGNTVDADSPVVQDLVLDSLNYWSRDMGVDGFRFDLATILARHADGFSPTHPLLKKITKDRALKNVKLIAEPWDPGPGGYRLGAFPRRWSEWNDRFRDASRRFWRGDKKLCGELAGRLHGSADLFDAHGRHPSASVNIISTHDGFTLADLASYEHRHNEANGEKNRDGHAHNFSDNHGVEGPSDDPAIVARRRQYRLNLLATLFVAQGTPLLLAGDEFGNSQDGNNNAYAQDNETGWLDWDGRNADPEFAESVKALIQLRRSTPLLRLDEYLHGSKEKGGRKTALHWINSNGETRDDDDWLLDHAFGLWMTKSRDCKILTAAAVLLNPGLDDLIFRLPEESRALNLSVRFRSASANSGLFDAAAELPGQSIVVITGSARA